MKLEFVDIQQELNYYIKVDFRIFRICPIMPQLQFIYKTLDIYKGHKMGKSLTSHKSAHYFFLGKNRNRKIRKKSGYEIPGIFGQILLFEHTLG